MVYVALQVLLCPYIPENILALLHLKLRQCNHVGLVYLCINQQPLYPFCLMKRICVNTIHQQINQHKLSLKTCFELLNAEYINIERPHLKYHSLNSLQELDAYQMSKKLRIN